MSPRPSRMLNAAMRVARGGLRLAVLGALLALVATTTRLFAQAAPVTKAQVIPKQLDALLTRFAQMPGFEARFSEEKRVALLAKPLVSEGRLWFAPPGLLLRRIESPAPSEVVITPSELRMKDAHGAQTLDLRARSDIRPFVESLTWLLAGNRKALLSVYDANYEAEQGGKRFVLTLTPKQAPISNVIAFIRVTGAGSAVEQVIVAERSGDQTLMTFSAVNPARRFTQAELKSLFGYGGS